MKIIDRTGWRLVRFGDVVREINDWDKEMAYTNFTRCIRGEDIDTDEVRIRRWGNVPEDMAPTFGKIFRAGQVLYHTRSPNLRKYSQVSFDGYCGEKVVVLETRDESVLMQDLIPYVLQSEHHFQYALRTASGSTNKFTSWKKISAYEFLLPPPEQQRELVELMQGFERAIEAGEETKRSVELLFEQMTDAEFWASDHQKEFCRLGDGVILQLESGISKSTSDDGSGFGVLMLTAFGKFDFVEGETKPASASEFIESKRLRDGDFLISRANLKERTAAIFRDNGNHVMFSDLAMRAELGDNVVPRYLLHLLNSKQGRLRLSRASASSSTGGMVKINKTSLRNVEIRLPQVETQKKIVTNLEGIYTQLIGLEKHVKLISQLRFSILNTALSPSAQAEAAAEVPA